MIKIAAVADIHVEAGGEAGIRARFAGVASKADLLLLPGDLTATGTVEQAMALARGLSSLGLPIAAVLGNHDFDNRAAPEIVTLLEKSGVRVLDGETAQFSIRGLAISVIGLRGFQGGFGELAINIHSLEPEVEAWVATTQRQVDSLERCLRESRDDYRVVMLHYSPVHDTVVGQEPEAIPWYGSSRLCEPIDRWGAGLVVHGHSHHGTRRGATPAGIPVYNVAAPLLDAPYEIIEARA
ncbi:MAG: metallophosphoesterase [Chloroflexia bacterium]